MDYPKTGKEARELGIKKYFTGLECKFGHIAPRHAHNGQCTECGKIAVTKERATPEGKLREKEYYKRIRVTRFEHIMWRSAQGRAKARNVPITITPQDIKDIWPIDNICPVLGIVMKQNFNGTGHNSPESPSLDCIKPHLGYVLGNVIIMSLKANQLKNNETDPAVFRKIAAWLENNMKD